MSHQDGVAGVLTIRLVEARNLRAAQSMFWVRTCSPYVTFRVGRTSARSTTIQANDNPRWRKEILELKIPKIDARHQTMEEHSNTRLQVLIDVRNEDSITGRATESVGIGSGSLIGSAALDFTALVEGKEEVLDRWLCLREGVGSVAVEDTEKKSSTTLAGEVRVILQYEPHGMEPAIGDVVKLEGYGLYPSAILPPLAELELRVKSISGSYLLCGYTTQSGFEGALRIHRNNVYVVHRCGLLDRLYVSLIATPLEFLSNTPLGQSCRELLRPYINVAMTFSFPAIQATRTTLTTAFRASNAALRAVLAAAAAGE